MALSNDDHDDQNSVYHCIEVPASSAPGSRFRERITASEEVLSSPLLQCRKCLTPQCEFRAPTGYDHCCWYCKTQNLTRAGVASPQQEEDAETEDGHDAACSRLRMGVLARARWEFLALKAEAKAQAACMVLPAHRGDSDARVHPAGVMLFLTGSGHVDDREDFFVGGVDLLLRNEDALKECYIVAPKPASNCGILCEQHRGRWQWDEHACWALLLELMRRLGPAEVDVGKIYVTGFSLGAAAVWHLGMFYGDFLAAIAPMSGRSQWPDETWPPDAQLPREDVRQSLERLPIRAYQIDTDHRAGTPVGDMTFLARGCTETCQTHTLPGMTRGRWVTTRARKWLRSSGSATLELWHVNGPLHDWPRWSQGDHHCIWYRVYPLKEWELVTWMLAHTVAPVLACEDTDQALQPLVQIHGTTHTVHEVFLVRATRALHKYRITSSSAPTDVSLGEHMGQLATEAHSADITGISPAVVRAEVSEQSTSLPGTVPSAADTTAFGSEQAEAQGLDVSVETKTCPRCGGALLWTDFKDGRYIHGWACDNHRVCDVGGYALDLSAESWWRWCCRRCHSDFCITCAERLVRIHGLHAENTPFVYNAGSAHETA